MLDCLPLDENATALDLLCTVTEASRIAEDARRGLRMVAEGEDKIMEGWLMYGLALNLGRKLFASNILFHEWLVSRQLAGTEDKDRAAAMWAAADPDTYRILRRVNPKVRTVRGLHAKWKEANQPLPAAPKEVPTEDELRLVEKLRALAQHPTTDPAVKANAQRKLDTYAERFGEVEPETPTQQLTKNELATAVTKSAVAKAACNPKAFEVIEFAIRQTYGSNEGHLERILAALKKL